jgi:hypothetical protein
VKASEYRAQVEEELRLAEGAGTRAGARRMAAALTGEPLGLEERRDLVRDAVNTRADLPTAIPALLEILRDSSQPDPLRGSALASLSAARFVPTAFAAYHSEFIQTLREVLRSGGEELRERALEILSVERDPEAQELLMTSLEGSEGAVVSPAVAIKYLSSDDHAAYAPVVRRLAESTKDENLKRHALRLLASDPKSKPLLERLLRNKKESPEVRRLSAIALHVLDPERFEDRARKLVADDDEDDDLRATCLGALTHVKDYVRSRGDGDFVARVDALKDGASALLKRAAERFVKRSR